jgi:PAS domain S-box-containing protein
MTESDARSLHTGSSPLGGRGTGASEPTQQDPAEEGRLLRLAFEAMPDLFVIYGPDRRIRFINRAIERITGLRASELLGMRDEEMIPREICSLYLPALEKAVETGETQRVELSPELPGAEPSTHSVTYVPVLDEEGRLLQVLGLAYDITDLRRTEEALRRERDFLGSLIQNTSLGVAVVEPPDWRHLMVNLTYRTIPGVPGLTMKGRAFAEVFPDLAARGVPAMLGKALESGKAIRVREFPASMGRGREETYWNLDFVPLAGQGGYGESVLILTQEVTDQVISRHRIERMASKLQENLSRTRAVLETVGEGIVIADMDGNVLELNPAALRFYGIESQEEARRHHAEFNERYELIDPDGEAIPEKDRPMARVLRGERFSDWDLQIRDRESGRTWTGQYGGSPVLDENGNTVLALMTVRDVSQRRRMEQKLLRMHDELEQRVEERTAELEKRAGQLARLSSQLTLAEQRERRRLGVIIHDHLQQLLVGAKINLEVLAQDLGEGQRQDLNQVYDLLIESLRTARTLSTQMAPYILYERGLAPALEWLARTMEETYPIEVETRIDPDILLEQEDMKVFLFESTRELLFNAVKHAQSPSARIELAGDAPDLLRITVSDKGQGFDVDRILPELGQEECFGLLSVRERLELMGGRLEIESEPGGGASFHLVVPMRKTAAPEVEEPAAEFTEEALSTPVPVHRGVRVLLVDDHVVMRQGLSSMLGRQQEIEVVGEAADGEEGVQMARELQPDVILMDISMPRMNGIEATRVIHGEAPHIRIIGLSMYDDAETERSMLEAGAVAFMNKSGHTDALLGVILDAPAE